MFQRYSVSWPPEFVSIPRTSQSILSKGHTKRHLNSTCAGLFGGLGTGDSTESGAVDLSVGNTKVRQVKQVRDLRFVQYADSFVDVETLTNGCRKVLGPWSYQK